MLWFPHKKNIRIQKKIKAATKVVPSLRNLTYEEILEELGFPAFQERIERKDLIAVYRLMKENGDN